MLYGQVALEKGEETMVTTAIIIMILGIGTMYAFLPWSVIGGALQDFLPGLFWPLVGGFDGVLSGIGEALANLLGFLG